MEIMSKLRDDYLKLLAEHNLDEPDDRIFDDNKELEDKILDELLIGRINDFGSIDDFENVKANLKTTLAGVKKGYKNFDQYIITQAAKRIEVRIEKNEAIKKDFKGNIYFGVFPTGSFNAHSLKVENGFLALINSGLLRLIHQVCKLLTFRINGQTIEPSHSIEETSALFLEIIIAYIKGGNAAYAQRLHSEGGERGIYLDLIKEQIFDFVLGHEYGHIIRKHFTGELYEEFYSKYRYHHGIKFISKTEFEELDADIMAIQLVLGFENIQISSKEDLLLMQNKVAAPFVFFILEQIILEFLPLIGAVDEEEIIKMSSTHPKTSKRIQNVHGYMETVLRYPQELFSLAGAYGNMLHTMKNIAKRMLTEDKIVTN